MAVVLWLCVGWAGDSVWEWQAGEGLDYDRDTPTSSVCIQPAVVRPLTHREKLADRDTDRQTEMTQIQTAEVLGIYWSRLNQYL